MREKTSNAISEKRCARKNGRFGIEGKRSITKTRSQRQLNRPETKKSKGGNETERFNEVKGGQRK